MTEVTGPLLRLERDADRPGSSFPHRLTASGGDYAWLTDAEAADFEARYWTGDLPRPEALKAAEVAEAICTLVAGVVGEDTPTPPAARVLPEGVHEAADGERLYLMPGYGLPAGWQWLDRSDGVWENCHPGAWAVDDDDATQVRPIPDPEPEPVPHTESIGRVTTESPWPVTSYHGHADGGRWVLCDSVNADGEQNGWQNGWDRVNADSSGMVLCLPITDGDGE